MSHDQSWAEALPCAITVCDANGTIVSMNSASVQTFRNEGGEALIGSNVLDCHPEPSRTQLKDMLRDGTENLYTIEKSGRKKLICQYPWFKDGQYAGHVEISIVLPENLPHFKRD